LDPEILKIEKKVATGFFAVVYSGTYLTTPVAIKVFKEFDDSAVKELELIG